MRTAVVSAHLCGRIGLLLCLFLAVGSPVRASDDPPIRVARLSYVERDVSFQPGGETDWGWATLNRPMTTGDSLWTGDRSRAEMHIGSTAIRVDWRTFLSFLNLDDGTVQIQLNAGTIDVHVRSLFDDDVFEVDTPNLAFTIGRAGHYRITVDPEGGFTTITLREGHGQITGEGEAFLVEAGSQVQVSGTDYLFYDIFDLPVRDGFDRWSYDRDLRAERSQSARYVSLELTGYEDLDQHGTWRTDRNYGSVWVPTRVSRSWAPYREGHWTWVRPWGWTWVDDAPFGFVTSHYGRWAYLNDGYGGRGWAWVPPRREPNQGVRARRPVYSPALVIFVGFSSSSREFGTGGRVAWFPLAPGEVYVPAYRTSPTYITNVNVTNTVVQQTTITNVVNSVVRTTTYVNQRVAGAVTAVPRATFVNAQAVAPAAVAVAPSAITAVPAAHTAPVAPVRASVMGRNRASTASATATSAPPEPAEAVVRRPVVARVAPPPPPVAFAQEQQALQAQPGRPLDPKAEQDLRAASPPRVARVVKRAPPAPMVKPAGTAPKKPQPATSPNKVQQARPPRRGGEPADAPSQQVVQQLSAEKANQDAAQRQAAQQQAAAEKAKQEAAQRDTTRRTAADKANQDAAQRKAAQQQAAAEKAKQEASQRDETQRAAADKANQDAAQRKAAQQQAAAEKARQEAAQRDETQRAAADKANQDAAQRQAAQQQAAAEKAKQEAAQRDTTRRTAADKANQDAAQRKAAQQQAAAEKARQEASQRDETQRAAADKANQDAAQRKAAQQQAAAEKARQEAAQRDETQRAAADKANQEAARQQRAQQQAAAEKARQEAAQRDETQRAAADKANQEAAQRKAAQQQAAAEKARQEAAQNQADKARTQKAAEERRPPTGRNARPPNEAPPADQPAVATGGPIRVAEEVQAARLISQPKLKYPPGAKPADIQGTVRVHVLIGTDGRVKNATVLSGPQPLHAAALDNARQRRYQPTAAGGKPVEVETDISIKF